MYELLYTPKADGQINDLSDELLPGVERALLALAETPASLSIRIVSPPFPPRGQLYHFRLPSTEDRVWFFTVIFYYSQDERHLLISSVTAREISGERDDEFDQGLF